MSRDRQGRGIPIDRLLANWQQVQLQPQPPVKSVHDRGLCVCGYPISDGHDIQLCQIRQRWEIREAL